jgi:hypothetical protein
MLPAIATAFALPRPWLSPSFRSVSRSGCSLARPASTSLASIVLSATTFAGSAQ